MNDLTLHNCNQDEEFEQKYAKHAKKNFLHRLRRKPHFPFAIFHEKAKSSGPFTDTIFSFRGPLNVMLPSALFMDLLVIRCMLGSVVGLQPSVRTRFSVA
jgi:hypothetical protein